MEATSAPPSVNFSSTTAAAAAAALVGTTLDNESDLAYPQDIPGVVIFDVIVLPILLIIIFIIGVVGNFLVIAVITKIHFPKQADLNNTQLYMLNLAIADLFFLLICIPSQFIVHLRDEWCLGAFLCNFNIFCETLTMFSSAYTLVALSFDRYFAIVHALKSNRYRTRRVGNMGLALIWTVSVFFAAPAPLSKRYYSQQEVQAIISKENPNSTETVDSGICLENDLAWNKYMKLANAVFGYAIPLLMIMFCYAAVLHKLYSNAQRSSIRETNSPDQMLHKVTRIVIVLVMVFAIDWLLYHTNKLWRAFGGFKYSTATYCIEILAQLLSYTNCCCNPLIYAFVSRSFRQDFKRAVFCRYLAHARERVGTKLAMTLRNNCKDEIRCLNITEDKTNYTNPDKTSPFIPKPDKYFDPVKNQACVDAAAGKT